MGGHLFKASISQVKIDGRLALKERWRLIFGILDVEIERQYCMRVLQT